MGLYNPMGKVNIYFPDDLEAVARDAGVKLSPVCQAAVRAEVERLARVSGAQAQVAEVVERLLQTKAEEERKQFNDGYEAGTAWARERATYSDLYHLSSYFGQNWLEIDVTGYDTIQGFLFNRALGLGFDPDPDWFERFRSKNTFDRAFIDGAKDIYEAVRPFLFEDPPG